MGVPVKESEMHMAYAESMLGAVLVIETSGSAYGSTKAGDGLNTNSSVLTRLKTVTSRTLAQMGTREISVHPYIKQFTG